MALQTGELVLFPRGSAHEVVHSPRGKAIQLETFLAKRDGVNDPNPKAVTLICGEFNMDQHLALPALRALPRAVSLRVGMEPRCSPLSDTLRMLRNEVETPNFGNQIVVRNLLSSSRQFSTATHSLLTPRAAWRDASLTLGDHCATRGIHYRRSAVGFVSSLVAHRRSTRFSPIFVALLPIFYFAGCSSISGFSVNPARTFSSALFAWLWQGIWIYFLGPCLGMLASAAIYIRGSESDRVYWAKVFHDRQSPCQFRCHFDRLFRESEAATQVR